MKPPSLLDASMALYKHGPQHALPYRQYYDDPCALSALRTHTSPQVAAQNNTVRWQSRSSHTYEGRLSWASFCNICMYYIHTPYLIRAFIDRTTIITVDVILGLEESAVNIKQGMIEEVGNAGSLVWCRLFGYQCTGGQFVTTLKLAHSVRPCGVLLSCLLHNVTSLLPFSATWNLLLNPQPSWYRRPIIFFQL